MEKFGCILHYNDFLCNFRGSLTECPTDMLLQSPALCDVIFPIVSYNERSFYPNTEHPYASSPSSFPLVYSLPTCSFCNLRKRLAKTTGDELFSCVYRYIGDTLEGADRDISLRRNGRINLENDLVIKITKFGLMN